MSRVVAYVPGVFKNGSVEHPAAATGPEVLDQTDPREEVREVPIVAPEGIHLIHRRFDPKHAIMPA